MNKQKGFTITKVLALIIVLLPGTDWGVNLTMMNQCDFKSDYTCELVHGIGIVIPILSTITVLYGTDL